MCFLLFIFSFYIFKTKLVASVWCICWELSIIFFYIVLLHAAFSTSQDWFQPVSEHHACRSSEMETRREGNSAGEKRRVVRRQRHAWNWTRQQCRWRRSRFWEAEWPWLSQLFEVIGSESSTSISVFLLEHRMWIGFVWIYITADLITSTPKCPISGSERLNLVQKISPNIKAQERNTMPSQPVWCISSYYFKINNTTSDPSDS